MAAWPQVSAKAADYKAADLARILYGVAAAAVPDAGLAKAVGAALAGKAGEAGSREAAQGLWALATLRRADKATVDALSKVSVGSRRQQLVRAANKLAVANAVVSAMCTRFHLGPVHLGPVQCYPSVLPTPCLDLACLALPSAPGSEGEAVWR